MNCNIIATVLKTGGIYNVDYVNRLANAIARHVTVPYRFVVLTDDVEGDYCENVHERVLLRHDLPGWWSKIELHAPDFYPDHKILFFDLDTVIVGNLDHVVEHDHHYTVLSDFYYPGSVGSGVMAWKQTGLTENFNAFLADAQRIMSGSERGDQQWIEETVQHPSHFQTLFPNEFLSYKKDLVRHRRATDIEIPADAKVICFHGTPKPHEVLQYNSMRDNWR